MKSDIGKQLFMRCDCGELWESQDVEERTQLSSWQLISPGPELHRVHVSRDVWTRWYGACDES